MRLKRKFLWACAVVLIFASLASAAERVGAIAATNARSQAGAAAAANLGGGGGPGVDLRAIANPNKQPQSFTGFPTGTLPGDSGGRGSAGTGANNNQAGQNAVWAGSGNSLAPIIGPGMKPRARKGSSTPPVATLEDVYAAAAHVGYTVVMRAYTPNSLDSAYTVDVMSGRSRKARVFLDRKMWVLSVVN